MMVLYMAMKDYEAGRNARCPECKSRRNFGIPIGRDFSRFRIWCENCGHEFEASVPKEVIEAEAREEGKA